MVAQTKISIKNNPAFADPHTDSNDGVGIIHFAESSLWLDFCFVFNPGGFYFFAWLPRLRSLYSFFFMEKLTFPAFLLS